MHDAPAVLRLCLLTATSQEGNTQPDLDAEGFDRAANLIKVFGRNAVPSSAFNSPNTIFAMKQGDVSLTECLDGSSSAFCRSCCAADSGPWHAPGIPFMRAPYLQDINRNSNRPFETVQQLAVDLGFAPEKDKRSVSKGLVFDNTFKKKHYKAGCCGMCAPFVMQSDCRHDHNSAGVPPARRT